jgi:hypothetical protein
VPPLTEAHQRIADRLTDKRLQKFKGLAREFEGWLHQVGVPDPRDPEVFNVQTRHGPVRVSPYLVDDDLQPWVACRWQDLTPGLSEDLRGDRLNRFSGKWNWHAHEYAPSYDKVALDHAQIMLDNLKAELLRLGALHQGSALR